MAGSLNRYEDISGGTGFWNGTNSFLQAAFPPATGNNGTGAEATSVTPAAGAVPGPRLGVTYTYAVSALIRTTSVSNNTGGGGGGQTTNINDIESTPVTTGPATPLPQP